MLEGTGVPIEAECNDTGWNGFHVPTLTCEEFNDYLAACKANDRNGEWDERAYEAMTPGPFATRELRLPYWDAPEDPDMDMVWPHAEDIMTSNGYRSGYEIDGLVWVDYEEGV